MDIFKKVLYCDTDSLKFEDCKEDIKNSNKISKEVEKTIKDLVAHAENVTINLAIEHNDIAAPSFICNPKDVKRYKGFVECIGHSNKETKLFVSPAIHRDNIYIIRDKYLIDNAAFIFKEVKLWD